MLDSALPSSTQQGRKIVVIGAGIGGLTAGALLARRGASVLVLEQAVVPGGCASTFRRRGFTFDVGATQVAGLEPGGIHHQIFTELGIELPTGTNCDPACAVFLPGETEPIQIWRDRTKWSQERLRQFPGSARFWNLMDRLFAICWKFQGREPILPPRSPWDLWQLAQALRLDTFLVAPFALMNVTDVLRLYGLGSDRRLRTFLDLQLKLYSQVDASETALLYAATALAVSQAPQGLVHLDGSMQVLSDRLVEGLRKHGGELLTRQRVEQICHEGDHIVGVKVRNLKTGEVWQQSADEVVANVTAQNLTDMIDEPQPQSRIPGYGWRSYQQRIDKLPPASGAFVIYLGVKATALPADCPPHLQFFYDYDGPIGENNSLFVSVSRPGDGRAPKGCATVIASSFTDPQIWFKCSDEEYRQLKQRYQKEAIARLESYFDLTPENIVHQEAATPRTFQHFTARAQGIVGGIGQRVSTFGPFGIATRTPLKHLWLVGDSTHPGEGTAGVSYSALMAVRQIEAQNDLSA